MNYQLNLSDGFSLVEDFIISTSVIDMLTSSMNFLGIPTIYIASVKAVDVQRWVSVSALEMTGVKPVIIGVKTYNVYSFVLHYRNMDMSTGFYNDDRVLKRNLMFHIIGQSISSGGLVVGMTVNSNYIPMSTVRGISWVDYTIEVWVSY